MESQNSGNVVTKVGTGVAVAGAALAISPVGLAVVGGALLVGFIGKKMIDKFNDVTIEGKHKDSSISLKGKN